MKSPGNSAGEQTPDQKSPEAIEESLLDLPVNLEHADIDPEAFKRTLIARRTEIIESIHRTYDKTMENFPGYSDSRLPGELVAVLASNVGERYHKVIEDDAYWSNSTGGIFTEMRDIKPKYHPFWIAVAEAGFIPEVRIMGSFTNRYGEAELNARVTPSIEP